MRSKTRRTYLRQQFLYLRISTSQKGSDTVGYVYERKSGLLQLRTKGQFAPSEGTLVTMCETWTETGMPEAITIWGETGNIRLFDLKDGDLAVTLENKYDHSREESTPSKTGQSVKNVGGLPYTHWGLIDNFVSYLLDGTQLLCDGGEGRKSTVILDALAKSPERDTWQAVEYR